MRNGPVYRPNADGSVTEEYYKVGDKVQTGEKEVICPRCNGNGTEVSAANRNNRKRGAANEYKAVDVFTDWWLGPNGEKYEWRKTPQSGGSVLAEGFDMAGDICTTAPDWVFHVEAKRTEGWDFGQLLNKPEPYGDLASFVDQATSDAPLNQFGKWRRIPMLWLMHPGPSQPTYIMLITPPHEREPLISSENAWFGSGMFGPKDKKKLYSYYIMNLNSFLRYPDGNSRASFWRMVKDEMVGMV